MNAPERCEKTAAEPAPARSRTCVIFAEPAGYAGYGWGWRCGEKKSKGLFRYFYECVQDARKHGYAVEFAEVAESLKSHRENASPPS